jgi:hypothetical protein
MQKLPERIFDIWPIEEPEPKIYIGVLREQEESLEKTNPKQKM